MLSVALGVAVSCLLLWLVALPLVTVGHELGHALAALWLTDRPVRLYVGNPPGTFAWRLGRLTCEVRWPSAGFGRVEIVGIAKVPRNCLGWIALGGPAASLLMLALGFLARAWLPNLAPFWHAARNLERIGARRYEPARRTAFYLALTRLTTELLATEEAEDRFDRAYGDG